MGFERQLTTAGSYWDFIVIPNYADYSANKASLAKAYNIALCLYHFADWLFISRRDDVVRHFGLDLNCDIGAFRTKLEASCPFGHLHDVVTTNKHLKISRSRGAPGIHRQSVVQKTTITEGEPFGALSTNPISGPEIIMSTSIILEDSDIEFDGIIQSVHNFWEKLRIHVPW